jgi:hypothetical protein
MAARGRGIAGGLLIEAGFYHQLPAFKALIYRVIQPRDTRAVVRS